MIPTHITNCMCHPIVLLRFVSWLRWIFVAALLLLIEKHVYCFQYCHRFKVTSSLKRMGCMCMRVYITHHGECKSIRTITVATLLVDFVLSGPRDTFN
jgi:hypothetical protein